MSGDGDENQHAETDYHLPPAPDSTIRIVIHEVRPGQVDHERVNCELDPRRAAALLIDFALVLDPLEP